jgi:hypothetical protein
MLKEAVDLNQHFCCNVGVFTGCEKCYKTYSASELFGKLHCTLQSCNFAQFWEFGSLAIQVRAIGNLKNPGPLAKLLSLRLLIDGECAD